MANYVIFCCIQPTCSGYVYGQLIQLYAKLHSSHHYCMIHNFTVKMGFIATWKINHSSEPVRFYLLYHLLGNLKAIQKSDFHIVIVTTNFTFGFLTWANMFHKFSLLIYVVLTLLIMCICVY